MVKGKLRNQPRPANADLKVGVGGRRRRFTDVTLREPTPSTDPKHLREPHPLEPQTYMRMKKE